MVNSNRCLYINNHLANAQSSMIDNLLSLDHDPSTTSISATTDATPRDTATGASATTTGATTATITQNDENASSTDTLMISDVQVVGEHLDLEAPIEEKTRSTPVFVLYYKTTHKGEAKCSAFSTDGKILV
jgi:GTP cyclohydrolase III